MGDLCWVRLLCRTIAPCSLYSSHYTGTCPDLLSSFSPNCPLHFLLQRVRSITLIVIKIVLMHFDPSGDELSEGERRKERKRKRFALPDVALPWNGKEGRVKGKVLRHMLKNADFGRVGAGRQMKREREAEKKTCLCSGLENSRMSKKTSPTCLYWFERQSLGAELC